MKSIKGVQKQTHTFDGGQVGWKRNMIAGNAMNNFQIIPTAGESDDERNPRKFIKFRCR